MSSKRKSSASQGSPASRKRTAVNSAQQTTDEQMLAVLAECLRNPSFHQKKFGDLRASLQALHGGPAIYPTPTCGTDPPFRTRVIAQLRKLKNLYEMWNPEDAKLSQRNDAFEAKGGLGLVTSLLGDDELKIEANKKVGKDSKPVRVAGLKLRKNDEKVNEKLAKKFIVHLSCPQLVSKPVVKTAYDAWLCMFHATVEVKVEPATSKKKTPDPASKEVHIYVEETQGLKGGTPAVSFFPNWDPSGKGNDNTIYIGSQLVDGPAGASKPAILHCRNNILGALTHEVGHTLGFAHEHRYASNSSSAAENLSYFKINANGKPELVTANNKDADKDSVMWYPKLIEDYDNNTVSRLSAEDKKVCKLLYGLPNNEVDEYPKPPASQGSSSSSAAPSSASN